MNQLVLTFQAYIAITFPVLLLVNMVRNVQLLSYFSLAGLIVQIFATVIIFQYMMQDFLSWDNIVLFQTDIKQYPIFISITMSLYAGKSTG